MRIVLSHGWGMRMLFAGQYLPRKGSAVLERQLPRVLREFPHSAITMAADLWVVGFAEGGIADIAVCGRDALFTAPGKRRLVSELALLGASQPGACAVKRKGGCRNGKPLDMEQNRPGYYPHLLPDAPGGTIRGPQTGLSSGDFHGTSE